MTALISLPLLLILVVAGGRRWVWPGRRDFRSIEEHRSALGVIEHAAGADDDGPGGSRPDATAHVRLVPAPPRPARARRADPEEWDDDGEPYRPPVRPSFPLPRDRSLEPPALPPPAPARRRLVFTDGLPLTPHAPALTPDAPALTPDARASRRHSPPMVPNSPASSLQSRSLPAGPVSDRSLPAGPGSDRSLPAGPASIGTPSRSLPAGSLPAGSLPGGPGSDRFPGRSDQAADPDRRARPARPARPAGPARRPGRLARRRTAGPAHPEPLLEPLAPEFGPIHMPEAMLRTLRDRAGSAPRRDAGAHRADDGVVVVSQPDPFPARPAAEAAPAPTPTLAPAPAPPPPRPAAEAAPAPTPTPAAAPTPAPARAAAEAAPARPAGETAPGPPAPPAPSAAEAAEAGRSGRPPVTGTAGRSGRTPRRRRRPVPAAANRRTRPTVVALVGVAAVLVAAAGVGAERYWSSGHRGAAGNRTVASAGSPHPANRAPTTVTVPPAPTVTQVGTSSVEASFAVSATPVTLSIDATGRCWVELRDVSPSGPVAYEGTLASGVSENFRAGAGLWLRLGDPNGVQVSVDGSPLSLPRTSNPFDVLVSGPTGA